MSESNSDLDKERQSLLSFIWEKRKVILLLTGIAMVASIVISLLMTPIYKSTAIVFPAATSTVSFSEQRNAKNSSMDFGEEDQAEQLVQILQSARIRNRIVERFKLMDHYEISHDDPNKNYKLGQAWENHIQFARTRYGSIQIDVWDRDRELAASIANKIVDLIDTVKNEMVRERTVPAFEISKRKREMLEKEKNEILAQMDSLSEMGVVPSDARANLFGAYIESTNKDDRAMFKHQLEVNELYGAIFDGLQILRDEKIAKLTRFEDTYEQAESDANTMFNHKFVVEHAVVADKKDKPKRMIIVLLTMIGTFVFTIFFLLVKERIKELRKLS